MAALFGWQHERLSVVTPQKGGAMSPQVKPSIVFCHGIFADGSCWNKLTGPLQAEGYEVIAAQYGLDTNEAAVTATRATLGRVHSPAILVGHSYGGAVITAAGIDDRVAGLVYVAALGPDETETSQSEQEKFPQTPLLPPDGGRGRADLDAPVRRLLLLRGPARGGAEAGLGDGLPPVRRPVRPQRPGRGLADEAELVHRGQQRPGRPPRPGTSRRQAHGRHHLRHRQQPRPHALPPRLRSRRHPDRRTRNLSPHPFLSPCSRTERAGLRKGEPKNIETSGIRAGARRSGRVAVAPTTSSCAAAARLPSGYVYDDLAQAPGRRDDHRPQPGLSAARRGAALSSCRTTIPCGVCCCGADHEADRRQWAVSECRGSRRRLEH